MPKRRLKHSWAGTCHECEKKLREPYDFTNRKSLLDHLRDTHGMDPNKPYSRKLLRHVDGREFYSSTYEWRDTDNILFIETYTDERADDDPMRLPDVP